MQAKLIKTIYPTPIAAAVGQLFGSHYPPISLIRYNGHRVIIATPNL